MIYCMSDIHGRLDLFKQMLDKISLSKDDTLYILGDSIDRGGGLSVLQKIMELQKAGTAQFIKGNHEQHFAEYITLFDPDSIDKLRKAKERKEFSDSMRNAFGSSNIFESIGGLFNSIDCYQKSLIAQTSYQSALSLSIYAQYETVIDYFALSQNEQNDILQFIENAPTFVDIDVSGKRYRLTHAGCNQAGDIDTLIRQDFFLNQNPIPDRVIVFGHSTTKDIRIIVDGVYTAPSIWFDSKHANDKVGIDCGAAFYGGKLACLRLEDLKEFYVDNNQEITGYIKNLNDFAKKNNLPVNPNVEFAETFRTVEAYMQSEKEHGVEFTL